MRIAKGIIYIILGIIGALIANSSLTQHFVGNKEKVLKYTSLANEGVSIYATLDSVFNETNMKIKGVEATVYDINYHFEVDGDQYEGRYFFDHPDSLFSPNIEVRYLEFDPEINAADVERELIKARENLESDSDLWFGLSALAASILLFVIGIKNVKRGVGWARGENPE